MSLMKQWRDMAYSTKTDKGKLQRMWQEYFQKEKEVYIKLLQDPETEVQGTVAELAEKYELTELEMAGFLDGIQESLKTPNEIEELEADSHVSLAFDPEMLYRNMVEAKADWLYGLEEWDAIFSKEKQEELYKLQKQSHTVRREGKKIGRNDPCPCGSGKKYKNCCGKDA